MLSAAREEPMIQAEEIRRRVGSAFPDATIDLHDTVGDADHYEMVVVSAAFAGKTTLERHRLVYAALKDVLGGALHALALKTLAPGEPGAGR
jgi:stress-induced morphogen